MQQSSVLNTLAYETENVHNDGDGGIRVLAQRDNNGIFTGISPARCASSLLPAYYFPASERSFEAKQQRAREMRHMRPDCGCVLYDCIEYAVYWVGLPGARVGAVFCATTRARMCSTCNRRASARAMCTREFDLTEQRLS